MASPTKFCSNCGAQVDARAEICPKCGVRIAPPPITQVAQHKNEGLAAILSFFIVGLGQIYNGQIGKGIIMMILSVFAFFSIIFLIGFIAYPVLWIYGIYDAYTTAKKINQGLN
ncbi:zinc-ribbon domain-containing protein [Candidatus Bathyarchaeota archaeon]|nr:zinc-ribbon domain-containing protein [Candidatus Bathyarchaeota archaeon]